MIQFFRFKIGNLEQLLFIFIDFKLFEVSTGNRDFFKLVIVDSIFLLAKVVIYNDDKKNINFFPLK